MKVVWKKPGRPMAELNKHVGRTILVAFKLQVCGSGASVSITTAYVQSRNRLSVCGYPHVIPFNDFDCWWPLPTYTLE